MLADWKNEMQHKRYVECYRPPEVSMIASFQFIKAVLLLAVAACSWIAPNILASNHALTSMLVYVASHGKDPHGVIILLYSALVAYMGWGLWRLDKWSRYSIMISSSVMVGMLFYFFTTHITTMGFDRHQWLYSLNTPADIAVGILVLIDILNFGCLVAYPDVVQAFEKPSAPHGRNSMEWV